MEFKHLTETMADDITKIKVSYGSDDWYPLVLNGIHNVILSMAAHKIKWFDESGTLRERKINSLSDVSCYDTDELTQRDRPVRPKYPFIIVKFSGSDSIERPAKLNNTVICKTYLRMVIRTMNEGNLFSEFIKRYNMLTENTKDVFYQMYDKQRLNHYSDDIELNKFIRKIGKPSIERAADNQVKNTFDFIRMRVGIPSKENNAHRKEFVQKNMGKILQILLSRLNENKVYLRYGVPINYLTLDHAVITSQDELEVVFKLKGQP